MTKDQSEESNSCSLPAIHINQAMNIINNSLKNNSTEYNVHCMFVVNSYAYKYVLQGRITNAFYCFYCDKHTVQQLMLSNFSTLSAALYLRNTSLV